MKVIRDSRLRWRIMIGLGTDYTGAKIDSVSARRFAIDIASTLDAFNITDGIGAWGGKQEPSLVIEYIGEEHERDRVIVLAETITRLLDQAEVWVSEEPVMLTRIVR